MIKYIVLISTIATLLSCKNQPIKSKTYSAFYYESWWELELTEKNDFIYRSYGHVGEDTVKGKFTIKADTIFLQTDELDTNAYLIYDDNCIVDLESHFNFCLQWPETWGSQRIAVNYPQIPPTDSTNINDVEWMLQIAINNESIEELLSDTTENLIIQEYFEIGKDSDINLKWHDKPVVFLSEEEIENKNIKEYLIIEELTLGLNSAMIDFEIKPYFPSSSLDFFSKKNGQWQHHENF